MVFIFLPGTGGLRFMYRMFEVGAHQGPERPGPLAERHHVAHRISRKRRLVFVVAATAGPVAGAWALQEGDRKMESKAAQQAGQQAGQQAPAEAKPSEESRRVLDRLRAHYTGLKTVSVKARTVTTMKQDEGEQREDQVLVVRAQRPNRASISGVGDDAGQYALVSDGEKFRMFVGAPLNKYSEEKAPATFADLLDAASMGQPLEAPMALMSPHTLVLALLDAESLDKAIGGAGAVTYIGREEAGGVPLDRIRVGGERMDVDLLVRAEGPAWIDKVVPDMSKVFKDLPEGMEEMRAGLPKFEITYTDWASPEEFPADAFAFTPPEGAEKVDSLMDAMRAGDEEAIRAAEAGHQDLLGRAAPALELDLLDGGRVSLAAHKGKDIVVIDFWATWCPPCVKGLPIVSETAAAFKDKGVVFYAVNEQEKPDTIKKFLEKNELNLKVPLDTKGEAGRSFGVTGIPQTVLIGRDGTVQAVHVGFAPSVEKELREELAKLVENKPLVEPKKDPEGKP
jgi:thiol-disulfide isomerase/thioredoxin